MEIARAGCPVILDWGFWQRAERTAASAYYRSAGIPFEWALRGGFRQRLQRNIAARNAAVAAGETTDYAIDAGLLEKMQSLFEPPAPEEHCIRYCSKR